MVGSAPVPSAGPWTHNGEPLALALHRLAHKAHEEGLGILANFADGAIDVSADWLGGEAPEALAAILDYHYPDGQHHTDYATARWRLQYIAEISVGARLRAAVHQEDKKVRNLKSVV